MGKIKRWEAWYCRRGRDSKTPFLRNSRRTLQTVILSNVYAGFKAFLDLGYSFSSFPNWPDFHCRILCLDLRRSFSTGSWYGHDGGCMVASEQIAHTRIRSPQDFGLRFGTTSQQAGVHHVGFQLLPERFSLTELQGVYEAILDKKLDKRNFRRD